jgi:hypothetical protein
METERSEVGLLLFCNLGEEKSISIFTKHHLHENNKECIMQDKICVGGSGTVSGRVTHAPEEQLRSKICISKPSIFKKYY